MDIEKLNSVKASTVGLMIPRHSLAGMARRSQSRLFSGGLPVR